MPWVIERKARERAFNRVWVRTVPPLESVGDQITSTAQISTGIPIANSDDQMGHKGTDHVMYHFKCIAPCGEKRMTIPSSLIRFFLCTVMSSTSL